MIDLEFFMKCFSDYLKVHYLISGDDDDTGARTFEDPHRKIFQRGGIDSFIMAVPK
jgi:hypothetical protein